MSDGRTRIWIWSRRLGIGVLSVAAAASLLELIAALRVSRLRAERAALGDRLCTEVRGAGDSMVFLAGLPATTRYWGHAFDGLAQGHRLIFVDALGFGRSPWPDVGYTLEDHLGALRRTLVAAGATRRVTLVGHSFGTLLAAEYAAAYPSEVARLVLLGTPVFDGERDARERIRAMSATAGLFSLHTLLARETCKLHEALGPLLTPLLPRMRPGIPAPIVEDALLHTWQSFRGSLVHVVLRRPIDRALAGLGARVTFVHGRRDGITELSRIHDLARRIGAEVRETEDDHLSYSWRSPERVVRLGWPDPEYRKAKEER